MELSWPRDGAFKAKACVYPLHQDFHQLQIENSQFVKRIEEANQDREPAADLPEVVHGRVMLVLGLAEVRPSYCPHLQVMLHT